MCVYVCVCVCVVYIAWCYGQPSKQHNIWSLLTWDLHVHITITMTISQTLVASGMYLYLLASTTTSTTILHSSPIRCSLYISCRYTHPQCTVYIYMYIELPCNRNDTQEVILIRYCTRYMYLNIHVMSPHPHTRGCWFTFQRTELHVHVHTTS